jgi:hypothetical protein
MTEPGCRVVIRWSDVDTLRVKRCGGTVAVTRRDEFGEAMALCVDHAKASDRTPDGPVCYVCGCPFESREGHGLGECVP